MFDSSYDPHLQQIRAAIFKLCRKYGDDYWLERDETGTFPREFVDDVAADGWFGVVVPNEHGGAGLGVTDGVVAMQAIVESGAGYTGAGAVANVMFIPTVLVKFGTEEQKARMLPPIASGKAISVFGVTEPDAGLDTTNIKTFAERKGDLYVAHGKKVWSSLAQQGTKLMLLARTSPRDDARPADGISLFYTDFDRTRLTARQIPRMGRAAIDTNELFIDGLEIPVEDRIGDEGAGFRCILHGLNSERILLAAMAIGLGRAALQKAVGYAGERVVFGRPIGKNQSIQHPLAVNWMELEAANLMMLRAARLYDDGQPCAAEANSAKYLAAEAAFKACSQAVMTHGGFGYAKAFHVERYMRESFVPRIAPVSRELIMCFIAEKVLGLPKSY